MNPQMVASPRPTGNEPNGHQRSDLVVVFCSLLGEQRIAREELGSRDPTLPGSTDGSGGGDQL
jgi:hypothetical protein